MSKMFLPVLPIHVIKVREQESRIALNIVIEGYRTYSPLKVRVSASAKCYYLSKTAADVTSRCGLQ